MPDLSEKALEDVVLEIASLCAERGILLTTKPRRLFVPMYPNESIEDYNTRVATCREIVKKLQEQEDRLSGGIIRE